MVERLYDLERNAASKAKELLEKTIGRRLRPKEYVYHKDGDIFNLEVENLELITPEDPRSIYYQEDERSFFGVEVYP